MVRGEHRKPIMQLFQRRCMWQAGLGQRYFLGQLDKEWLDVPIHALPFVNTGLAMDDGPEEEDPLAHLDDGIPVAPGMARL